MIQTKRLSSGLRYRHWTSDTPTKAVVLLIHGLGEHSGRYEALGSHFASRGLAVIAPDHLGHGESPGERVFLHRFDEFLPGVRECRALIHSLYPEVPCFVLGHSMGGLITARLLLDDQSDYRGALFSGPAFAASEPPNAVLMLIGRLLAKIAPRVGMVALDSAGVSRDPLVVADYNNDPLVHHGKITAGLAVALFAAMDQVKARAADISLPVLVMHGAEDVLAAPVGSEQFAASVCSEDKTLSILPGLFHEIFNEPEGPGIIAQYADWIEARL